MKNYILIDAHIHFHEQYDVDDFFRNAFLNFKRMQNFLKAEKIQQLLCFTESFGDNLFEQLKNKPESVLKSDNYRTKITKEENSLIITDGTRDIFLIAGRQIVTKENLEVLAIGMGKEFEDGEKMAHVLTQVINSGIIPIIPWGVGKWFSKRKDILEKMISEKNQRPIFLGDNGNRPWFWSKPNLFQLAAEKNIFNLPGSDPLPFKSEVKKPGSFGFIAYGILDEEGPYHSLYQLLLKNNKQFDTYGKAETLLSFLKNQISMQIVKRIRKNNK